VHDISEAQKASQEVVSLPMFPDMDENTMNRVIEAVRASL